MKYLITLFVGFAGVGAILWGKDIFSETEPQTIFHMLCDAFFAVGVVITGAGLLVFSANEGTFDALVYGVTSFLDMFRKERRMKYDTFFDYRHRKAEKKLSFGFIVLCGLFFLLVSFVMYYFYSRHAV